MVGGFGGGIEGGWKGVMVVKKGRWDRGWMESGKM